MKAVGPIKAGGELLRRALFVLLLPILLLVLLLSIIVVLILGLSLGLPTLFLYWAWKRLKIAFEQPASRVSLDNVRRDCIPVPNQLPPTTKGVVALPKGIRISKRKFYRWHDVKRIWTGEDFRKTFQDDEWKWKSHGRFAGKNLNCGHYFAFTPDGASAEAHFYSLDCKEKELLDIDAEFESVLDLTYPDTIRTVLDVSIGNPEALVGVSRMFLVSLVATPEQGGDTVTDSIGVWASNRGYEGILFYSARSVDKYTKNVRNRLAAMRDTAWGFPVWDETWEELQRHADLVLNLVIFSGISLVRAISNFESPTVGRNENPYYGMDSSSLDALVTFGPDFQEERRRYTWIKPRIEILD